MPDRGQPSETDNILLETHRRPIEGSETDMPDR